MTGKLMRAVTEAFLRDKVEYWHACHIDVSFDPGRRVKTCSSRDVLDCDKQDLISV